MPSPGEPKPPRSRPPADGLRLLPAGRTTDIPWLGIDKLPITLSQAYTLTAADVFVTSAIGINYGPVTVSGSGTNYTITLAQPINAADLVTLIIDNPGVSAFYRQLDVLPGDFNDDGVVNSQDLAGIRNEWLGIGGAKPTIFGDINRRRQSQCRGLQCGALLIGTSLPAVSDASIAPGLRAVPGGPALVRIGTTGASPSPTAKRAPPACRDSIVRARIEPANVDERQDDQPAVDRESDLSRYDRLNVS